MIQAGDTEGISDIVRFVLEIDKVADWLITLWKEFDVGGTSEARFAKSHRPMHADPAEPVQSRRKLARERYDL